MSDGNGAADWIAPSRAARMLQVHPQTVKAWAQEGYLVGFQAHRRAHHLISLASVQRILDARERALQRLEDAAVDQPGSPTGGEISADSDREGESAIAVGGEAHKRTATFWTSMPLAHHPHREHQVAQLQRQSIITHC